MPKRVKFSIKRYVDDTLFDEGDETVTTAFDKIDLPADVAELDMISGEENGSKEDKTGIYGLKKEDLIAMAKPLGIGNVNKLSKDALILAIQSQDTSVAEGAGIAPSAPSKGDEI